ncbi:hypothetical protein [Hymenobacter elongatus]|uniref:Uncharacterized protein n=1 Tax=Hymenobacter elongatus TaxID=877208 RepID=A0A4Z0PJH6_9BACT|nr:hypothetical protein [Hymenobacter elongatus]TGE15057.1 hypothetical protein E5J99_13545 [Hymenobacter elongatus]
MSSKSNQQSKEHHGDPAGQGQSKGDPTSTPVNLDAETKRLTEEYTEDGVDEIPPTLVNNPNRNTDKTDLDNTPYT